LSGQISILSKVEIRPVGCDQLDDVVGRMRSKVIQALATEGETPRSAANHEIWPAGRSAWR